MWVVNHSKVVMFLMDCHLCPQCSKHWYTVWWMVSPAKLVWSLLQHLLTHCLKIRLPITCSCLALSLSRLSINITNIITIIFETSKELSFSPCCHITLMFTLSSAITLYLCHWLHRGWGLTINLNFYSTLWIFYSISALSFCAWHSALCYPRSKGPLFFWWATPSPRIRWSSAMKAICLI